MITSLYFSAVSMRAFCISTMSSPISTTALRTYICKSTAHWSLRLRPVCKRPPASPISSVRRFSIFIWISSRATENGNSPLSIWPLIFVKPATIASRSASEIIFCFASIVAWALLPAISSAYILASKAIEDVKSSTALSVPFVKRPPHNLAIIYLPFLSLMH